MPADVETTISSPSSISSGGFKLLGEEFLACSETSKLITKTERTLEWWRETRQGPPYVRLGKTILYRKSELLRWLVDQEVMPRKSRKVSR
jgi:hypothetical protein